MLSNTPIANMAQCFRGRNEFSDILYSQKKLADYFAQHLYTETDLFAKFNRTIKTNFEFSKPKEEIITKKDITQTFFDGLSPRVRKELVSRVNAEIKDKFVREEPLYGSIHSHK